MTAFLPWLFALAIPAFTSAGLDTGLPATSRMMSPSASPCSAAVPFGSTPTMATPLSPILGRSDLDAERARLLHLRAVSLGQVLVLLVGERDLSRLFVTVAQVGQFDLVVGLE